VTLTWPGLTPGPLTRGRRPSSASSPLRSFAHRGVDRLVRLPVPQGDAMRVAFGLCTGDPPDRLLVALALLILLSEVAAERPLLCVVDDAQWLNRASAQAVAFVARRLATEAMAFVFGAREVPDELCPLRDSVTDLGHFRLRRCDRAATLPQPLFQRADAAAHIQQDSRSDRDNSSVTPPIMPPAACQPATYVLQARDIAR